MNNELLVISNLELTYHTKQAETKTISNLNFSLDKNEFVSIVGPSGCGKTTILSIISGLLKPSAGKVTLNGKIVDGVSDNIGYMFQRDNLFQWLTVKDNVLFGLKIKHILSEKHLKFALDLVEKYGLKDFLNHYPQQLSGGMRQRVSLIRTLATMPELLLLDEPFSALDYQTRLSIQNIVSEILKQESKTALLVTHDISEAIAMSNRIIILSNRPAKVKKIISLDFDKNLSPFERRGQPQFNTYFNEIWRELRSEK